MSEVEKRNHTPEDVRAEYEAVLSYHTALVNSRFTIAGLYVAAVGFLASAIFNKDVTWVGRAAASGLACWLTLCLWVLELRSRALYTNLAQRGIDIEHRYWNLVGNDWYQGFFSRQYREPPSTTESGGPPPPETGPDRPTLGWSKRPLPESLSRWIRHSMGLDLLYAGVGLFWLGTLIVCVAALSFRR